MTTAVQTAMDLRDNGMALAIARDEQDTTVVEQAIRAIGETCGWVSANDIHDKLPELMQRNVIGAVFAGLKSKGLLAPDGYVTATHAEARCRPIRRWRWLGPLISASARSDALLGSAAVHRADADPAL